MNVHRARKIDYWIGVPLCFALTALRRLGKALGLGRYGPAASPQNLLFIELSEMGSAVIAAPMLRKAAERYPQANLHFLVFEEIADSVRILGIIPDANVITIRSKSAWSVIWTGLWAVRALRQRGIDTAIDLELFSRVTAILGYLSGARRRVGFDRFHSEGCYRGNLLTHRVAYNPHQHIALNFFALLFALDAPADEVPMLKRALPLELARPVRLAVSEERKRAIRQKLQALNPSFSATRQLVLLNPVGGDLLPLRRWPLRNYCELAQRLLANPDLQLGITGTAKEKPAAQAICEHVEDPRCLDLTGQTTFRELMDLYSIAGLLITNDSGPAHFTGLTDIKAIVLYGPETPRLYGSLSPSVVCVTTRFACSPCVSAINHRHSPCADNRCLQQLNVDAVHQLALDLLAGKSPDFSNPLFYSPWVAR